MPPAVDPLCPAWIKLPADRATWLWPPDAPLACDACGRTDGLIWGLYGPDRRLQAALCLAHLPPGAAGGTPPSVFDTVSLGAGWRGVPPA